MRIWTSTNKMLVGLVVCLMVIGLIAGSQPSPVAADDPIPMQDLDLSQLVKQIRVHQAAQGHDLNLRGGFDLETVAGKTFEVWFTGVPGEAPGHDCWTFTQTEMCSVGCGGCGQLLYDAGNPGYWVGWFPCPGPSWLIWWGTSLDAPAIGDIDVLGASGIQVFQDGTVWNWGAGGVEHPECTLSVAGSGEGYSK